jgi:hypothetical protein
VKLPVIVLCGNKSAGKDTAADMLVEMYGGKKIAHADPIKGILAILCPDLPQEALWGPSRLRDEPYEALKNWKGLDSNDGSSIVRKVLGWDDREMYRSFLQRAHGSPSNDHTPRYWLQAIGGWVRSKDPNAWVRLAHKRALDLLIGGEPFVYITDGRFRNEVLLANQAGFQTWRIDRPGEKPTAGIEGHASETELASVPDHWFDFIFLNDRDKEGLGEDLINSMWATFSVVRPE